MGELIVLNGTTSSGKTTLAVEMQRQLGEEGRCWVVFGIDDFRAAAPTLGGVLRSGAHAAEGLMAVRCGDGVVLRTGSIGRAVLGVYRQTIASLVRNGLNVIVDEVVLDEAAWAGWETELRDLDPLWVRVDCPTEVCEQRERARGDRLLGLARTQAGTVHRYPTYHVAVDTSTAAPIELAQAVIAAHAAR
ncbi:MAG: AAA family ATPase [Acidimicrobiales bacterium]